MAFDFVVDKKIKQRAYPALARWEARPYTQAWREFGQHWPWTTPLRIEEYCRQHGIEYHLYTMEDYPDGSFYPICLGFFDFDIDYIQLLPDWCRQAAASQRLRVLFMYHEGDNPARIKHRLDALCGHHGVDPNIYLFVSANSAADKLERFFAFHDFELWYHQRNIDSAPLAISAAPRPRDFLCLNRVHKSWRANMVADLRDKQVLDNSLWSYCMLQQDHDEENPLQIDTIPQLRYKTKLLLDSAPYHVDDLDNQQRNDHALTPVDLMQQTYCNIVMESQFDVDQSGGVFLTEKTFKAIKHGQIFFIAGAAGSLAELRRLGYRVFDHALDNSYDVIEDATQRWLALRESILQAHQQGLHTIYQQCIDDLRHNQQMFMQAPVLRLNTLAQRLEQTW